MNGTRRRGGLVGPLILISLGIVFLLNNLGTLNWDVWLIILRLWPLLLVAAGLDILIGGRSLLGSVVVVLVTLALVGGALWLVSVRGAGAQAYVSESVSQSLQGATRAQVQIAPSFTTLRVQAQQGSQVNFSGAPLVQGTVATSSGERVTRDFSVEGDTASLTLRSQGEFFFPFTGPFDAGKTWDLDLNAGVPLQLRVDLGVGDSVLDLNALNLTRLDVNGAIGRTTVTLPHQGKFTGKISAGIGELVVLVPAGMAAQFNISTGLGSTRVPPDYRRTDNSYTSPDYAGAENRADLDVSGGIGTVSIQETLSE